MLLISAEECSTTLQSRVGCGNILIKLNCTPASILLADARARSESGGTNSPLYPGQQERVTQSPGRRVTRQSCNILFLPRFDGAQRDSM